MTEDLNLVICRADAQTILSILRRYFEPAQPTLSKSVDELVQEVRSLPKWFGIESAILHYCHDLAVMETYIAEHNNQTIGFITLNQHNAYTGEIHLIAVVEEWHRQGVGQALVKYGEERLRSRTVEYLEVKTLGPSHPDANYAKTRDFYLAMGFRPVEENQLWGEGIPCLILIKHLLCHHG